MIFADVLYGFLGRNRVIDPLAKSYNNNIVGRDLDANAMPAIDYYIPNILDPYEGIEDLLIFTELERGKDLDNNSLRLGDGAIRRTVALYYLKLNQVRGTIRAYEIIFGWLNISVVVTQYFTDTGFDSGLGFDSDFRDLDSYLNTCMRYDLTLTGVLTFDAELLTIILSVITFNNPINATVSELTYNGTLIGLNIGDFNGAFNNDFS